MTKPTADMLTALDALRPQVAADFVGQVESIVRDLLERYDERGLRSLANQFGIEGGRYRSVRAFIRRDAMGGSLRFDREGAERAAEMYAEQQVEAMKAKLLRKVGGLTNVEVRYLDAGSMAFSVTGDLGERKVRIDQDRIFKWSPKGVPFHQWPARIYVDGQFTPEAQFKKLSA